MPGLVVALVVLLLLVFAGLAAVRGWLPDSRDAEFSVGRMISYKREQSADALLCPDHAPMVGALERSFRVDAEPVQPRQPGRRARARSHVRRHWASGSSPAARLPGDCSRERPADDPALGSVIALCRRLEQTDTAVDIGAFAAECGYSERHLRRRFSAWWGYPSPVTQESRGPSEREQCCGRRCP